MDLVDPGARQGLQTVPGLGCPLLVVAAAGCGDSFVAVVGLSLASSATGPITSPAPTTTPVGTAGRCGCYLWGVIIF